MLEHLQEIIGCNRRAKEKALCHITPPAAQKVQLISRLDAFCDDAKTQSMRQYD